MMFQLWMMSMTVPLCLMLYQHVLDNDGIWKKKSRKRQNKITSTPRKAHRIFFVSIKVPNWVKLYENQKNNNEKGKFSKDIETVKEGKKWQKQMDKAKISIKFSCFSLSLSFILDKRKKHKSFFVARIKWRGRGKIKKKKSKFHAITGTLKIPSFLAQSVKGTKNEKRKKLQKQAKSKEEREQETKMNIAHEQHM